MNAAIETERLSRRFGRTHAVTDLTLSVPEGSLFAFVGPNGAGKTTTIKVTMNLLEPSSGTTRVMGIDSRHLRAAHFEQIGYVSENQQLPEWMTVRQLVDFCRPLYRSWDTSFAGSLLRLFDLPGDRAIKTLSRGMRMKAALLVSLAYRPRLLVMDEPFAGLDALVREEVVQGMLELTAQERWTVFISSHDIDEVERLADWVGFINHGRMQLVERVPTLLARFRQVTVTTGGAEPLPSGLPSGWLLVERGAHTVRFVDSAYQEEGGVDRICQVVPNAGEVDTTPMSLKSIFVALARTWRARGAEEVS